MTVVALDTMVLSHFARAGRLALLEQVLASARVVTTQEVMDELRRGAERHLEIAATLKLGWITEVGLTDLDELQRFAEYSKRLGNGARNLGERTVLAWAESHGAMVVLDDHVGRQVARERHVKHRGTLWVVHEGVKQGLITWAEAEQIVQALRAIGARLPPMDDEGGFETWARHHRGLAHDE